MRIDQNGALLRPGRIDRKVCVDYCDADQLRRLLFHFYDANVIEPYRTKIETLLVDDKEEDAPPAMPLQLRKAPIPYFGFHQGQSSERKPKKKKDSEHSPTDVILHIQQSIDNPEVVLTWLRPKVEWSSASEPSSSSTSTSAVVATVKKTRKQASENLVLTNDELYQRLKEKVSVLYFYSSENSNVHRAER